MTDLPPGWAWTTLGEVAKYTNGRGFKKSEWGQSGRPIIRIQNLTGSGSSFNYYAGELIPQHLVKPGDLLVSWAATLSVHRWSDPREGALNQHIFKVEPYACIDDRYLEHALRFAVDDMYVSAHGSGMVHITRGKFEATPILLPPFVEQQRIVEVLDDHLSMLDKAEEILRKASARVLRLQALTFDWACTGHGMPEPATVGQLCEVFVGATPSRSNPDLWEGELPWVSSGEVAFNRIKNTREKIRRSAAGNPRTRIHPPGTVMIAMIGEGKTRGQVAILDIEAAHNQNCASIRVDPAKLTSEFVYYSLRSRYEQNRSTNAAGGVQPALNKSKVQQLPLPLFELEDQRRIVDAVESADLEYGRLTVAIDNARFRSKALRRSLFRAAFNGELVDQDPSDEPAEVALQRLRAQPKPVRKGAGKSSAAVATQS